MNRRESSALDRYITGNYGENQFARESEEHDMATKTKKYPKFKSWRDLYDRCKAGDEMAQKACICGLSNLGNPTLPDKRDMQKSTLWQRAYHGLQDYIIALVGEYGESETKAERSILAEVNNVLDICHDTKLED